MLIPASPTQSAVALHVKSQNTILLENLVISGFNTGIETSSPARLQLKNVYFKHIGVPVRSLIRQDTFRNTLMTISVQEQALPPKPPRR